MKDYIDIIDKEIKNQDRSGRDETKLKRISF